MDEKTTDALREVLEDMAQALQLAAKSGEALIIFLEDMLSALESWAALYNVTLDTKPAMALHSHHLHLLPRSSQIDHRRLKSPEQIDLALPSHQDVNEKQGFTHSGTEAEYLGKGEATSATVLNSSARDVVFDGRNSVGIFCFEAEYERARMQAEENRHDNRMDTCESSYEEQAFREASRHAGTEIDMHVCGKRAKTTSVGSSVQHVKEEGSQHEKSSPFLEASGAFHVDSRVDYAGMRANIAPSLVDSSLHLHHAGMHAYNPAPKRSELNVVMPLQDCKREPCTSEQKGNEMDSDWFQEGASM